MIKNYLYGFFFLGVAIFLCYTLYERSFNLDDSEPLKKEASGSVASMPAPRFPDEIKIVRSDGTELDVRLIARNATQIQFERLADGQTFVFAIDQLDLKTRGLIERYPNTGLKDAGSLLRSEQVSLESAYVEQLREAIARIDEKLKQMETEFAASDSKVEQRTLRNNAKKLLQEREELESKIAERDGI